MSLWEEATLASASFQVGPLSWSNWDLDMLVLVKGGKRENLEKNPWSKARMKNKLNPLIALRQNQSGFVPFSLKKFPGLFQDSDWFFQDSKIHMNFCASKISILILLTVCHTFQIFHSSLTNFHHFSGLVALFQDFSDVENDTIKLQDFSGFPEPVRTLSIPVTLVEGKHSHHCTMPCSLKSYHWKLQKLIPVTDVWTYF